MFAALEAEEAQARAAIAAKQRIKFFFYFVDVEWWKAVTASAPTMAIDVDDDDADLVLHWAGERPAAADEGEEDAAVQAQVAATEEEAAVTGLLLPLLARSRSSPSSLPPSGSG